MKPTPFIVFFLIIGGNIMSTIAHKLAHALDRMNGTMNTGTWFEGENKAVTYSEIYATHVENIVRVSLGLGIRRFYSEESSGKLVDFTRADGTERYTSSFFLNAADFLGTPGTVNTYKRLKQGKGYEYKKTK